MRSVVLYCPHLNRDLSHLREAIPDLGVLVGMPTPRGEDGCLEMHKQIVRSAMERGDERIFIMEDDCRFTEHFNLARWEADADWAQANGYDVLAGGCTRTYDEKIVREGRLRLNITTHEDTQRRFLEPLSTIVEVSAFHSAHCLVYFKSGYEKVQNAIQPYDWSLGRDCGMRCALVMPFVAVQGPSYSGILRQNVDYVPLYAHHEAALRSIL